MSTTPDGLRYTAEHEWVGSSGAEGALRFGITDYAQESLGDIVYVSLPSAGDEIVAGQSCGEVESTKSVSEVFAPVTGVVVGSNASLDSTPELVNTDPYGEGWMVEVRVEDAAAVLDGLLDAAQYGALTEL